jgi:hypothetical protein
MIKDSLYLFDTTLRARSRAVPVRPSTSKAKLKPSRRQRAPQP